MLILSHKTVVYFEQYPLPDVQLKQNEMGVYVLRFLALLI